jgi:hypothetical protein
MAVCTTPAIDFYNLENIFFTTCPDLFPLFVI